VREDGAVPLVTLGQVNCPADGIVDERHVLGSIEREATGRDFLAISPRRDKAQGTAHRELIKFRDGTKPALKVRLLQVQGPSHLIATVFG
jgi:hypothetical protein